MRKLKRIKVFHFALFQGSLTTLLGAVCGIFYSFGGLIIDILVSSEVLSSEVMETPGLSYGTILAFGALIAMPIIGGFLGLVAGVLEAILYNYVSKMFGGLKIDFEERE